MATTRKRKQMLAALAAAPKVPFIDAQGPMPQQTDGWHDELQPSQPGFDDHTQRFRQEPKALCPDRVA